LRNRSFFKSEGESLNSTTKNGKEERKEKAKGGPGKTARTIVIGRKKNANRSCQQILYMTAATGPPLYRECLKKMDNSDNEINIRHGDKHVGDGGPQS